MKRKSQIIGITLILALALPRVMAADTPNIDEQNRKAIVTIKKMLASVRLNKFDRGLTYIGIDEMTRYLLDKYYTQLTPEQLQKFQDLLGEYIKLRAFPLANKYIGDVDVSYDRPVLRNGDFHVRSSVIYAGSERLIFTWVLKPRGEKFVIVDFINAQGQSSMQKNRDKQILPLYRRKGVPGLLGSMDQLVRRIRK